MNNKVEKSIYELVGQTIELSETPMVPVKPGSRRYVFDYTVPKIITRGTIVKTSVNNASLSHFVTLLVDGQKVKKSFCPVEMFTQDNDGVYRTTTGRFVA